MTISFILHAEISTGSTTVAGGLKDSTLTHHSMLHRGNIAQFQTRFVP